jgi:hypothetical protein
MQPSHAPTSPSSKLQKVPLTQPQADGPRHSPAPSLDEPFDAPSSLASLPKQHAAQSSSPSEGRPSWPHAAAEEKEEQDSQPPLLPSSKLQNSLFEQPQDDGPRHSAASTTPASASAAMIAFWVQLIVSVPTGGGIGAAPKGSQKDLDFD